jgi:hypothetical protein
MISNTHEKTYHKRLCSAEESDDIFIQVEKNARTEPYQWSLALDGRRTSDSHADSSGDDPASIAPVDEILEALQMGRDDMESAE